MRMKKGTFSLVSALVGITIGAASVGTVVMKRAEKETNKYKELADKYFAIIQLYNQWLTNKQEGKTIVDYLNKVGIKMVAIYGMNYVGERLYDELKNSDIEVKYAIDKNADIMYEELDIVTPEEEFEEVDAVIVTATFYFEAIEEMLGKKMECPILSLKDVLYEM